MATSSVGRTTINGSTTVGGFNPLSLFAAGEQGVWYDPSDFSTLFQDSAGTTPVTALEQPVGRILDKSGRGNHATQSTNTSYRPVVSARVNLLTYSQAMDSWTKNAGATAPNNQATAPDGTNTANAYNNGTDPNAFLQSPTSTVASGSTVTFSMCVKYNGNNFVRLAVFDSVITNGFGLWVNLNSGGVASIGTTGNVGTGVYSSSSISNLGNGWYRVFITGYIPSVTSYCGVYFVSSADNTGSRASNGAVYVWGADLRPANQGVGLPVYQRVGAAVAGTSTTAGNADYDANGFPVYLSFDGSNDALATGNINFSVGDQVSAFVGVRKNSDASIAVLAELGTDWFVGAAFALAAPNTVAANYGWNSAGSAPAIGTSTNSYAAPNTAVLAGTAEINPSSLVLRINGVQNFSLSTSQGTGNYSNAPFYIGARAGTSLFFNGNLYGLIVRGASSTANQITGAENWLNQKTAAY